MRKEFRLVLSGEAMEEGLVVLNQIVVDWNNLECGTKMELVEVSL